ncbi:MAG: NADPH-dependent oxidoreductase [Burkholderiaceae bacterium]|nr:NADPH-dependent oxidoreductase [Burkholderiaceae bacterium]
MSQTALSLSSRYGGTPPAVTLPALPIFDTLLAHASVRHFLPDALPEQTLPTLLAAAQSAASSSNLQTWSVVAVQSQERRDRLSQLAGNQAHIRQAPLLLVWLADLSRTRRMGEQLQAPVAGTDYLDTFLMSAIDATLAAQNATLAAEALGLGTVYIGGMRNQPEAVAQELGLPPGVFAVFGLVVGHPDPAKPAAIKPRLPQSKVLHHEQYQTPTTLAEEVGDYDAHHRAFQASQGMPIKDWSQQVVERLHGPECLSGRHLLVESLHRMGFPLR